MATFAYMYARFEACNINKIAMNTLEQKQRDVVSLNVEQMMDGYDKNGRVIGEYKNESYRRKKNRMNPRPGFGFADLKLTGKYHESLKLEIESDKKYKIFATDTKAPKIEAMFGKSMYGLDNKSKSILLDNSGYRKLFFENLRRELNL